MPIFEYRCSECGEKFETLVFSSSSEDVECPACGSTPPEKLISMFASSGDSAGGGSSASCTSGSGYFT
ncbi:MAG: zinc ribbon domain-containing protein [Calditrichia bacterium]